MSRALPRPRLTSTTAPAGPATWGLEVPGQDLHRGVGGEPDGEAADQYRSAKDDMAEPVARADSEERHPPKSRVAAEGVLQ